MFCISKNLLLPRQSAYNPFLRTAVISNTIPEGIFYSQGLTFMRVNSPTGVFRDGFPLKIARVLNVIIKSHLVFVTESRLVSNSRVTE